MSEEKIHTEQEREEDQEQVLTPEETDHVVGGAREECHK
jgi:hypothetical protein